MGTLSNKVNGKHGSEPGHHTLFSGKEEACLIEHVQVVAQWRFPMDYTDMRILARTSTATNRRG